MNIVFIAPFAMYPKGTVGARMIPIARALMEQGRRVTILVPPWDYPTHSGLAMKVNGVPLVNMALRSKLPLLWYLLLTVRLIRAALALKPDVVHAFKPKGFSGLALMALWLLKRFGLIKARLVLDTDDWEGPGGWNDLADYPWWQRAFFPFQERWLLRRAEAVTVASRYLEKAATAIRGDSQGVHYLPNGCWPTKDAKEKERTGVMWLEAISDCRVVLLYTRFVEFRVERVIEIMKAISDHQEKVALLVVGEGFGDESARLRELSTSLKNSCKIVQVGWVEPHDLPGYYAMADLAIYPMDDTIINRAKCPAKLVELLSASVPVVADRVGQVSEYIVNGESGITVEPGDTSAFAREILRLLRDDTLRRTLGRGGKARVEATFRWDHLVKAVEEAYAP